MENIDKSNIPENFPKFLPLESSVIRNMIDTMIPKLLQNMVTVLGIEDQPEISIDYDTMSEIISRVEKRRVYFHIYYNGVRMGELNEASLICFWILKLMPFKHATISNTTLNTKIAYTFFLNVLFYVAAKSDKKVNVREPVLDQLLYAFRYRDLSKEAIMALAESLLY
jgi:hypothetical protein